MNRSSACLALLCVACCCLAAPLEKGDKVREAKSAQVRAALALPVSTPEFEGSTPLKEALAFLSDKFDIPIMLDSEGFRTHLHIVEPENQPVKLAKMEKVSLDRILRLLLVQCQAEYFVLPDGIIQVVPKGLALEQQLQQPVTVVFDKKPLQDALEHLHDHYGLSIVLDAGRAGEKARAPVTTRLQHVSLDTALRVLADLAGLKSVRIDSVVYVTTPENARKLRKEYGHDH